MSPTNGDTDLPTDPGHPEQEGYLSLLLQSARDYAIFTTSVDGDITTWNTGAEVIFGYGAREILGTTAAKLWTPEDQATGGPDQEMRVALKDGVAEDRRWHQRKDGTQFYASGMLRPMKDRSGNLIGFAKICRDATAEHELAQVRHEIARSTESERARMSELFEQAPSFMAVLQGSDHLFERANSQFMKLTGGRELVGRRVVEAFPELAGQGFLELLDQVYATGQPFSGHGMRLRLTSEPKGVLTDHFVDFVYQALRSPEGTVTGIFVQGIDMTARRMAEEGFRRLAAIVDSSDDAVISMDLAGIILSWNPGAERLLGYAASEIVGASIEKLLVAEARSGEADFRGRIIEGDRLDHLETVRVAKDGTRVEVSIAVSPIRNDGGTVVGVSEVARDIGARRALHQRNLELLESERAARVEAEHAGRMKDEFLATLSHELRTPLSAILGWTQILASRMDDPKLVKQGLEVIARNAQAQTKIIEDLLDMSRIISGKIRLEIHPLSLSSVIEAAMETVRPAAEAKGIRISASLDRFNDRIQGDPNRLQQVFWNLMSNGVKFTPAEGRIDVRLVNNSTHLEVAISDSGRGLDPEFLPHVFARFRQADASTSRTQGGLGLGLAIVKQLVELHGGSVRAESPGIGLGSTFYICLPSAFSPFHNRQDSDHTLAGNPTRESLVPGGQIRERLKVLIVEDEPDARDLLRRVFEECHSVVLTAASAADALRSFSTHQPDIVVSDIGMPGEDGYSLMRKIRQLPADLGGNVPGVALTAYARPQDRADALEAGFQAHLTKPVNIQELLNEVARLTGGVFP